MSTSSLLLSERTGVIPMHEENEYWEFEERNLLARNVFLGLGYVKHVHRAITTSDGTIPRDGSGGFIFNPDLT